MQKKYIGSCKKQTGKYGEYIAVGLSDKDLNVLQSNLNERGWVNLYLKQKDDKIWLELLLPDAKKEQDNENIIPF